MWFPAYKKPSPRPWPFPGECRQINPGMKNKAGGVRPTSPHHSPESAGLPNKEGQGGERALQHDTLQRTAPLPSLPAEERRSGARGGRCSFASPPRLPWAERPPQAAVTQAGPSAAEPLAAEQSGAEHSRARGSDQSRAERARPRPPRLPAGPAAARALRTRGFRPSPSRPRRLRASPPRPVRGPGKRGGSRCQRGLLRLLRFGYRALVLSPCAQPILPSAGPCRRFEIYRSLSLEFSMWP